VRLRAAGAALLLLLLLLAACSGDREPETIGRDGSAVVEGGPAVRLGEPPPSYRVTYRVEQLEDDRVMVREGILTVVRPFQSRFEIDRILRVAHFAYFGRSQPGDETEVVTPVPSAAPGDVRADILPLGEGTETREIIGRRCRVHRFGASLLDGLFVEGDRVEACIDADGLVLEEVTTIEGAIVTRRVATAVELEPTVDDDHFELTVRVRTPDEGGGSVREITATSASPGAFWQLTAPPPGFEHLGRYATVPPQTARLDDEQTRGQYLASVTDVFTRGLDVLVIEQGGTLGQVPPFGAHPHGRLVDDLGELAATGEIVQHPNGAEVRVLIPPGRFVKVSGTMTADELVAVARSLQRTEGQGLEYVDAG